MKQFILLFSFLAVLVSCKNDSAKQTTVTQNTENMTDAAKVKTSFKVTTISHATMMLQINGLVVYVDPVGGADTFKGMPAADLILVTDIHGDHFSEETLNAVVSDKTTLVMPQACVDKLSAEFTKEVTVIANDESKVIKGLTVLGVPMYNLREEDKNKHVKGRGNGYVVSTDNQRIYISGDTEDIPEMRALKNIDVAFVCMNLPYTMTVESAANAVLEFAPKTVYPYHYRGANGLSDVSQFKSIVNTQNKDITVTQLDWYAQ
jgi:L-ascorbate metabolism protein UlaG (beta-lactamase superfamily)